MHIDWWTLALQAINVLILVWILSRFLYRPVVAMIEQRRAATAKILADASAMRDAAQAEKAAIRATRDGFAAERDALLADARKKIDEERNSMMRDASERIETMRTECVAGLDRERAAAERELASRASGLAVEIAQKLLERLPPGAAMDAFLDALSAQIQALPPRSRELLAASTQIDVATAATLNEAQQRRCRSMIEATLGSKASIAFKVDPRLIAGITLSAGALVLKNNWQTDLSQILERLEDDDGQR